LRLAYAADHRDAGARPASAGGASGPGAGLGIPEAPACARAAQRLWLHVAGAARAGSVARMEQSDIRERFDWRRGRSRVSLRSTRATKRLEKKERRPMIARMLAAMLGGLSLGLIAMPSANAQTVEQFYRGKTVTVLVGTSPGGINDIT